MQVLPAFLKILEKNGAFVKNADFGHQTTHFENLSEKMRIFAPRRLFLKILSKEKQILTLLLKKAWKTWILKKKFTEKQENWSLETGFVWNIDEFKEK